jgi:hypothetical protein
LTQQQLAAWNQLMEALTQATVSGLFDDVLAPFPNGPDIINDFCDLAGQLEGK